MANASIGQAEKIVFRKFTRDQAASLNLTPDFVSLSTTEILDDPTNPDPTAVTLLVNPYNVTFSTTRIEQRQQTMSRGRFVVQDWGTDLTVVKMQCQTGNILPYNAPEILNNSLLPEPKSVIEGTAGLGLEGLSEEDIVNGLRSEGKKIDYYHGVKQLSINQPVPQINTFDTKGFLRTATSAGYTGLIMKSLKFRTFLQLFVLYNEFDANNEILFMTFSRGIFRGYMTNFTFSVSAESPWNWKFDIEFVVLQGLSSFFVGSSDVDMSKLLLERNGGPELEPALEPDAPLKRQQTREFAVIDGRPAGRFEKAYNVKFTDLGFTGLLGRVFKSPQQSPESIIDNIFGSL